MKKFKIPVIWEMAGTVEIEAETLEDAINKFDNGAGDFCGLPSDGECIDDSFHRSCEDLPWFDVLDIYNSYQ